MIDSSQTGQAERGGSHFLERAVGSGMPLLIDSYTNQRLTLVHLLSERLH